MTFLFYATEIRALSGDKALAASSGTAERLDKDGCRPHRGGARKRTLALPQGQVVSPVGDSDLGARLIPLPDQSRPVRVSLHVDVQTVD